MTWGESANRRRALSSLQLQILVRRRVRMVRHRVQAVHLQPRPHAGEERRLDDGAEHRAVVDDLLELDQNLLAGPGLGFAGLLSEEAVQVGTRATCARDARYRGR